MKDKNINRLPKILYIDDLASMFNRHSKTVKDHLNQARLLYPTESCLNRKIGGSWFCLEDEFHRVIEILFSTKDKNDFTQNLSTNKKVEEAFFNSFETYEEGDSDLYKK